MRKLARQPDNVSRDLDRPAGNDRAQSCCARSRRLAGGIWEGGEGAERRVTVTGRVREQFFVERKKAYRQNLKFFLHIANATRNG